MENVKKVIVGKIPSRSTSFTAKKNDVLISVRNGEIVSIRRMAGKQELLRDDNTEWYFVDESEYQFDLSYSVGDIAFNFSFKANAAFPTLLINDKKLRGKDMTEVVLSWAETADISNTITTFLTNRAITSEKRLFEGNYCEMLERELMNAYRKHFITEWGMFLNSVSITKKLLVTSTSKKKANPYRYII